MTSKSALIVDDDPQNATVLQMLLEIEGFASYVVTGGMSWKAEIDALPAVAIVFLDLHLPRISGYDIFSYLKSVPRFNSVPVVAYTVNLNELHTVSELGFNGFIGKPVNAEMFPGQLAQILRGEKVWYQP